MNSFKEIQYEFEKGCNLIYKKYKENKLGKRQQIRKLDWLEQNIRNQEFLAIEKINSLQLSYSEQSKQITKIHNLRDELEYQHFGILNKN
jgi:hypothetical protein